MKRKTMTLVLCLLAALALVSVGFASWVITFNQGDEITGNISVEEVVDKRLVATASFKENKSSFVFGPEKNASSIENAWLTNDNTAEEKYENLSVTVVVKVTKGNGIDWANVVVKGTLAATDGVNSFIGEYIQLGTTAEQTFTKTAGKEDEYEATFSLKWGEKFGGDNPYKYYNTGKQANDKISAESSITWAEEAYNSLSAIKALEKEGAFKITVTVSATK